MSEARNHIFNRLVLSNFITHTKEDRITDLDKKLDIVKKWKENIENRTIFSFSEKNLQGVFLCRFFGEILGYEFPMYKNNINDKWTMEQEQPTQIDSSKPDCSLGFFDKSIKDTRVVIELKDANTNLDKKQLRKGKQETPTEQAFSYFYKYGNCKWVIVSNFIKIRLYRTTTMLKYEEFDICNLTNEEEFVKFYYLLSKERLISKNGDSYIDSLYNANLIEQENISKKFYREYRGLRLRLFKSLLDNNPICDKVQLLEKAQKIMDRFIFIGFCKDIDLLPNNIVNQVLNSAESSNELDNKLWQEFKILFKGIDEGNPLAKISRFNGGLFKTDKVIDSLNVSDDIILELANIAKYNFHSDLDVNILGHIFEQSIDDIEKIKKNLNISVERAVENKRKQTGIYYTPEYITRYMIEVTIGRWLEIKRKNLGEDTISEIPKNIKRLTKSNRKILLDRIDFFEKYKKVLSNIKIIDTACGSGAFLNQAFDYLIKEGQQVNEKIAECEAILRKVEKQYSTFDLNKDILLNNLYGVDLNKESVEITKLALWIKTANKYSPLTSLDDNIRCGNSICSSRELVGDSAFDWKEEFKGIMNDGGFDIVIGNPPYLGEKGNKKIFRMLAQGNMGHYYQSKMDLLYFFFHLALDISKEDAEIALITTNYYLTADGAIKLRNDINKRAIVRKLIDFNELKLFEAARGQHNMITVLSKGQSKESIADVCITKKKGISDEKIFNEIINGSDIDTEYRQVKQVDLYDVEDHCIRLLGKVDVNNDKNKSTRQSSIQNIIQKMSFGNNKLTRYCNINSGADITLSKITKSYIKKYSELDLKLNSGVFVITKKELDAMNLLPIEKEYIKDFIKGSNIEKYNIECNDSKLIYLKWTDNIDTMPNIYRHMSPYRKILEEQIERYEENYPWYAIHRPRNEELIFKASEKILVPSRSKSNTFGYCNYDVYSSRDVFYLTSKNNEVGLKYILALLNSKLFYTWFYYCGKRKGDTLELYGTPLSNVPITKLRPEEERQFIELVNNILVLYEVEENKLVRDKQLIQYQKAIDNLVYEIYHLTQNEIKTIEELSKN